MTILKGKIKFKGGPRYIAIADAITAAIENNDIPAGTKLPPHRELADELKVSVHTASTAYAEVVRRGLVTGEVGRGTYVIGQDNKHEARFLLNGRKKGIIDFSNNTPVVGRIHEKKLLTALAETTDVSTSLLSRPINGPLVHREAGAVWLRTLGLDADPNQIIITNGTSHAIMIAAATLTKPGNLVVSDSLADHGIIALSNMFRFKLKGLDSDEFGIIPQSFEVACKADDIKVLFITANFNNPTASLMPEDRREEIAEIARKYDISIIEDDVHVGLVPGHPKPISFFAPERSYYATSFTKTVLPGLRTGYLLAPEAMTPYLISRLRATSWRATPLITDIATKWIHNGIIQNLIFWQQEKLKERQKIVADILEGQQFHHHPTSLNAWLTLPEDWRAGSFEAQAKLLNIIVTPAEPFVVGNINAPQAIRISIGETEDIGQLEKGLRKLKEMLVSGPEPNHLINL